MEAHEKGIDAGVLAFARDSGWGMPPVKSIEIAIQAYLEASNQVLVPMEPTEEMAQEPTMREWSWGDGCNVSESEMKAAYRQMISVAPNPFKDK